MKGEYIPPDIPIQHVDEFLKLLEVLVGEKRYEEILKRCRQMVITRMGRQLCVRFMIRFTIRVLRRRE